MHINDIVPSGELEEALALRLVNCRESSLLGAVRRVYKYGTGAQIQRVWNRATMSLRGVVTDAQGNVLARGFSKFFNLSEYEAGLVPPLRTQGIHFEVTDKADGSALLVWRDPELQAWCGTTLGSLDSDEGAVGRELLAASDTSGLDPAYSYMFEIISPRVRCVIDYHEREELVLLGKVGLDGHTVPLSAISTSEWPGARTQVFSFQTIEDVKLKLNRPEAEGYVIHFLDTDERAKLKQDDYVALHRIIFGINNKVVWAHLRDGKDLDDLISRIPEEFEPWVRAVAEDLQSQIEPLVQSAEDLFQQLQKEPWFSDRGEFARRIAHYDRHTKALLFAGYDGNIRHPSVMKSLWRAVEPEYQKTDALPLLRD